MYSDAVLRTEILHAMEHEASLTLTHIRVAVRHGIVTLSGSVCTYLQKIVAETAAWRAKPIDVFADDLDISLLSRHRPEDRHLLRDAFRALAPMIATPEDKIRVTVYDGWVIVWGRMTEEFQRLAVDAALSALTGIRGVSNLVSVARGGP